MAQLTTLRLSADGFITDRPAPWFAPGSTVYLKGHGKEPFVVVFVGLYAANVRGRNEEGRTITRAVDHGVILKRPSRK